MALMKSSAFTYNSLRNQALFSIGLSSNPHYEKKRKTMVIAMAKKKEDTHSFVVKPEEATGPFPEAVLLKKKVVKEDGRVEPEFADAEEENLYEFLSLQLESNLDLERKKSVYSDVDTDSNRTMRKTKKEGRMRHYEVVYLIHEDHVEEVDSVVATVQDFIREKEGRIYRLNNWGLRRLAYKIKKASKANYILTNFEFEAKCINEFKTMLDRDERIIRHLVIKRDEAVMEDCPPPLEFQTLKSQGMDDEDEEEEEVGEWEEEDDDEENNILVREDEDEINDVDDGRSTRNLKFEKLGSR